MGPGQARTLTTPRHCGRKRHGEGFGALPLARLEIPSAANQYGSFPDLGRAEQGLAGRSGEARVLPQPRSADGPAQKPVRAPCCAKRHRGREQLRIFQIPQLNVVKVSFAVIHISIVSPLVNDVRHIAVPSPIRSFEALICRLFRGELKHAMLAGSIQTMVNLRGCARGRPGQDLPQSDSPIVWDRCLPRLVTTS